MIVKHTPSTTYPTFDPANLKLKILLVEKHWPDQRLVSKMLETRGCTVTPASNLPEAGNLIKNTDVDMVLMDTDIFRNNGFDIKAAIEASELKRRKRIPMIALSENYVKAHHDYFMGIGMDAYIPKPVFEQELCRVVARLVKDMHFMPDASDHPYQNELEETTAG